MITPTHWEAISAAEFENLALEHVRDLYPAMTWSPTRRSRDGGKDAVGEKHLGEELSEIYWMEAKHRPRDNSIGPYTLDTHLVSFFFARSVKRLHVVTSGRLSSTFLLRADAFARDHGFVFSHSDREVLTDWISSRRDVLRYFNRLKVQVTRLLDTNSKSRQTGLFGSAFFLPEDDTILSSSQTIDALVPGRKYLLIISFSISSRAAFSKFPITLHWSPNPRYIYLLLPQLRETGVSIDPTVPLVVVPFRLLQYTHDQLPEPTFSCAGESSVTSIRFRGPKILPKIVSPFVGDQALRLLTILKRILVEDVREGHPHLVALAGRAGSGKSRIGEELRDEAQRLGFVVRAIRMETSTKTQEDKWRTFFRWLFGLENNLFGFRSADILDERFSSLQKGPRDPTLFDGLSDFLLEGHFSENLFDRGTDLGTKMADLVDSALRELPTPLFLEVEDAHHSSQRLLSPLYFLKSLLESRDSLSVCILVTARADETVVDRSIDLFTNSLRMTPSKRVSLLILPDFSNNDARELLIATLQWPELRTHDSLVMEHIIRRAGTNAFSLMQTIEYIAIDKATISFGLGETTFLIDIPAFKTALEEVPEGIHRILHARLNGLRASLEGRRQLGILVAISLFGRESDPSLLRTGVKHRVRSADIQDLIKMGYITEASEQRLLISHDLLVDELRRQTETEEIARNFAMQVRSKRVDLSHLGNEAIATIFFYAGTAFANDSWQHAEAAVRQADAIEDHCAVLAPMRLLEAIAARQAKNITSRGIAVAGQFRFGYDLRFIAAIADQHCGNTKRALDQFRELLNDARGHLTTSEHAATRSIECAIEAANQGYLRLELKQALSDLHYALDSLNQTDSVDGYRRKDALLALAHNRHAAILQVTGDENKAEEEYGLALEYAEAAAEFYLGCHTLSDLGALLRFRSPRQSRDYFMAARKMEKSRLPNKQRRRMMLECSDKYSETLLNNNLYTRAILYSLASEATEKGFLFQAAESLLCAAYCAISVEEWSESEQFLFKVLDVAAISEDIKARLFAYHYLAVAAAKMGAYPVALGYSWQAERLTDDPVLLRSTIATIINENSKEISRGDSSNLSSFAYNLA